MLFMHIKQCWAEKLGLALQKRERPLNIVDLWFATGIQRRQSKQIAAKSWATHWTCQKGKLDQWMQDWLTKRQPAPNPSNSQRPVHSCNTFSKTMPNVDSGPFMAKNRTSSSWYLQIFPSIDWIFPGEALTSFFGAQDGEFSEFRSR